jgi:hypothetical protein
MMPPKSFVPDAPSSFVEDTAPAAHPVVVGKDGKPLTFVGYNKAGFPMYHGTPSTAGRYSYGAEDVAAHASPILGAVGGLVGSAGGPLGAVLGAAYGGYLGKGIERDAEGKPRSTLSEMGGGLEQGAYEATGQIGGRILGRLAKPVLEKYPELLNVLGIADHSSPKAVGHLTAAAATKGQAGPAKEAIAATIGDIESEMNKLPLADRNVNGFLDVVTRKRAALHEEYGNALGPHANQGIHTENIVRNLEELRKPWMYVKTGFKDGKIIHEGQAELDAINDAVIRFQKPRTIGELDSLRQQLNSDLSAFYAKGGNARYAAENGNINLAIDAATARGARNILYPIADHAAGKPEGYFADVLDREGNLIQLRGILEKRVQDLGASQAISEVTPRFSSENLSLSAHAGSLPRAGIYGIRQMFSPTRELTQAGKHVAKAFPGATVDTLPYGVLFSDIIRGEQTLRGPKTKKLQDDATFYRTHPR